MCCFQGADDGRRGKTRQEDQGEGQSEATRQTSREPCRRCKLPNQMFTLPQSQVKIQQFMKFQNSSTQKLPNYFSKKLVLNACCIRVQIKTLSSAFSPSSPPSSLSVSQNIWTAPAERCTRTSWRVSTGCGSLGRRAPTPSWPTRWVWEKRSRRPSSSTRSTRRCVPFWRSHLLQHHAGSSV